MTANIAEQKMGVICIFNLDKKFTESQLNKYINEHNIIAQSLIYDIKSIYPLPFTKHCRKQFFKVQRLAIRRGCLQSYSQAEPGRELMQTRKHPGPV